MVTVSMVTEMTATGDRIVYSKDTEEEHGLFFCVFSI